MRVFSLTKLGKRVARKDSGGTPEERCVMRALDADGGMTEDELEIKGGERWVVRRLKRQGLVRELTQSDY